MKNNLRLSLLWAAVAVVTCIIGFIAGRSVQASEARATLRRAADVRSATNAGLLAEIARLREAPVYLCGTIEVDGEKHPVGIGVTDELRLISARGADYRLRRQSAPCPGMGEPQ